MVGMTPATRGMKSIWKAPLALLAALKSAASAAPSPCPTRLTVTGCDGGAVDPSTNTISLARSTNCQSRASVSLG